MNSSEVKITRRRLANSYLTSLISISLVLLLFGIACVLLVNAKSVSDYFKESVRVSVLFKTGVNDDEAQAYCAKLSSKSYIRSTEFISKERGTEEMKALLGEDFMNVFTTSPVPSSVEITLPSNYVETDSLEVVKSWILSSPLVSEVSYQQSLIDALNENLRRIALWIAVFIGLLLVISFALISNTVRLSVYSRRFTVHTMKLVGATRAFIRKPFLIRGAVQGLIAALLASSMMAGGLFLLKREFSMLLEIFKPELLLVDFAMILVFGVLICLLSTFFVVNKLVSFSKDELYYQ